MTNADDGPALPATAAPSLPGVSVVCPNCGAKLRNTTAEHGAKIRCLNCGNRFAVDGAGTIQLPESGAQNTPRKAVAREPRAAGYWLLRVPAVIWIAASTLIFLISVVSYISMVVYSYSNRSGGWRFMWEMLMPLLYLPLLPLSAVYFYVIATAMGKTEAAMLKALWQRGVLKDLLPAMTGSSLPYIGPLAVGSGMILAAFSAQAIQLRQGRAIDELVPISIMAVAGFLVAFMCEDVRQFFSRQKSIADSCVKLDSAAEMPPQRRFSLLGAIAAAGSVLLTIGLGVIAALSNLATYENMQTYMKANRNAKGQPIVIGDWYDYYDPNMQIFCVAVIAAAGVLAGITVYLLCAKLTQAASAWWQAAKSNGAPARPPFASSTSFHLDLLLLDLALGGFVCLGTIWLFYISYSEKPFPKHRELFYAAMFLIWVAGLMTCATLSMLLRQMRSLRQAQTLYVKNSCNHFSIKYPTWLQAFFACAALMGCVQFIAFLAMIGVQISSFGGSSRLFEEIAGISLAAFIMHYPIVWITWFARECALIQRLAMAFRNAPIQAETGTGENVTGLPSAESDYPRSTDTAALGTPQSL